MRTAKARQLWLALALHASGCVRGDFRIVLEDAARPGRNDAVSDLAPVPDVARADSASETSAVSDASDVVLVDAPAAETPVMDAVDAGSAFQLTPPPFAMVASRGHTSFVVRIAGAPATGAVTLSIEGLPTGVFSPEETVAAGTTEVRLQLDAAMGTCATLPYCSTTARIRARSSGIETSAPLVLRLGPAPGTLDREYGSMGQRVFSGVTRPGLERAVYGVAVRGNGVVVAGASTPLRGDNVAATLWAFDELGRNDVDFGSNGARVFLSGIDANPPIRALRAVRVTRDGALFAAGVSTSATAERDWIAVRTTPTGERAPTFGESMDGFTLFSPSPFDDEVSTLEVTGDGVYLSGSVQSGNTSRSQPAAHTQQLSFDGRTHNVVLPLVLETNEHGARVTSSAIDTAGRVIFAGELWLTTPPLVRRPFVLRMDRAGMIDGEFGDRGARVLDPGTAGSISVTNVTVTADGFLVLAGSAVCALGRPCPVLVRLSGRTGNFAPWTTGGTALVFGNCTGPTPSPGQFESVVSRPGGGFIAAGSCSNGLDPTDPRAVDVFVQAFTSSGVSDPTFTAFSTELSGTSNWDSARALVIDAQGGLVVAGDLRRSTGADGFVLRLWH